MSEHRLLIVTPVRNEAAHIRLVAVGLAAQTRPPARWLVVDDGSEDDTPLILRRLQREHSFMRVVTTPPDFTAAAADRLAVAAAPRAFNFGLASVEPDELARFTHIGKLDGDIQICPDYFEKLLEEFDRNPRLGIGGGVVLEDHGNGWEPKCGAPDTVRGALKLYTRECLAAIGGVREQLGWDGIDQVMAHMKGFETRSFDAAEALHYRHTGSADGRLRGHVRWGEAHWILHHGLPWTVARAGKVATVQPRGISALAYLYGYGRAAVRRVPQVDVDGYREYVRAEQRQRISSAVRRSRGAGRGAPSGV